MNAHGLERPRLLTLYSGWAIRSRTLPSGERQILSVLLPGDLIGFETLFADARSDAIEAVTDVTYCVFNPGRVDELLLIKSLARRILSAFSLSQQQLSDRLTVIGACDAPRNLAHFICDLHDRLHGREMVRGLRFKLPLTHRQLAEALGLTTVHLHRTLRALREQQLLQINSGSVEILNLERLRALSPLPQSPIVAGPLI
jgi:CRP/FNR family transcriptional regulator, anaerobic regulatory protein